jgi:hypothetical protein
VCEDRDGDGPVHLHRRVLHRSRYCRCNDSNRAANSVGQSAEAKEGASCGGSEQQAMQ